MQITEVLEKLNIHFRKEGEDHHARQGWIQVECPWCGKDTGKHHLGFSTNFGNVNCWKCGVHRTGDTLALASGHSLGYCLSLLKGFVPSHYKEEKLLGRLTIPNGVDSLSQAHIKYLRGRGFHPNHIVQLWDIKGIGIASELSWSLFIPIYLHGKIVSWTTRSIADRGGRYSSASRSQEAYHHKDLLYGGDYVRGSTIVCEGPTDVWRIGPGAVATLGLSYTTAQIYELGKIPRRTICFDRGKAAQDRAKKLAKLLCSLPGETQVVELESGEDPDTADSEELEQLRKVLE